MSKASIKADSRDRGRSSARRKTEAVLLLLRAEDLDTPSRDLGVTAVALSRWREGFLSGAAAMKSRQADDRDEEIARSRSRVGQLTSGVELLEQECRRPESGRTPVTRGRGG